MAALSLLVMVGAGDIGAHTCKAAGADCWPVAYDSLVTGWHEAMKFGPFEAGGPAARARRDEVFARWKRIVVINLSALSPIGEVMADPAQYWRAKARLSLTLLKVTAAAGRPALILSWTCATYVGGENEAKNTNILRMLCAIFDEKRPKTGSYAEQITFVSDRLGHNARHAIAPARIRAGLGWQPSVTLEEGLSRSVDWYLANGLWWRGRQDRDGVGRRLGTE